jgi:hypothetical protein
MVDTGSDRFKLGHCAIAGRAEPDSLFCAVIPVAPSPERFS